MTEYYERKKEEGNRFQDFIVGEFFKRGWVIVQFNSKAFQYRVGESLSMVEIKNDQMFRKTGNLYFEIREKTNANNPDYVPSGLMRDDNSIFYVIGDESKVWVFSKKLLLAEIKAKRFEYRRVQSPTSIGYLLPLDRAEELAVWTVQFDQQDAEENQEVA